MLIDAHAHIFPPRFIAERKRLVEKEPYFALLYADPGSPMADHEQLLGHMDTHAIDQAWVVGFSWHNQENAVVHNNYLLEAARAHPSRLCAFGGMWPSAPWARQEAERVLASGIHGLGELAFYDSDLNLESLFPLCRLCQHYNVPLMLHVNEPIGKHYAGKAPMGLASIYQLMAQRGQCRLILSHLGGGVFFYKTLKAAQVRTAMQNVWLDIAAAPFLYQPLALKLAVDLMGADKILLGSDYPLLNIERTRRLLLEADLGPQEMELICAGNAAAFWDTA